MLIGIDILIVVCIALLPNSNIFVLAEVEAVMRPVDPNIEEGETLVLNCTITKLDNNEINSSMISIRSKNVIYKAPRYVFPLDERTAQFRLEKVTVNDTGLFLCVLPNVKHLQRARQYVYVFRRPLKPQVTNCTLKQMTTFECHWLPPLRYQQYYVNIEKSLKQVLQVFFPNNESITNCSSLQSSNCSISLIQDQRDLPEMIKKQICVKVLLQFVIHPYIETQSDLRCWNLSDTIYPEAPKFMEMIESKEGCLLKWNQPFNEHYKSTPLNFHLTIFPSYNKSERFFLEAKETFHMFTPCQAYTNYSACISSMSVVGGFPSDITCFTFETLPTVPCQSVETSPYLVFNDGGKNTLIYWKPLEKKNFCGSGFHYVLLKKLIYNHLESYNVGPSISGKDGTAWMIIKPVNASFTQQETYNICPGGDCTFAIAPKNDRGFQMDNITSFQLPNYENAIEAASVTIDNLICEVHEGSVMLSWRRSDLISKMNATVVIYTCKVLSHPSICRNDLQWKVIKSNVEHYNLSMGSDIVAELNYGIAVFVAGFSSEIFWCNKIYNLYGHVSKPTQLYVGSADAANQMDVMQVHWSFRQEECSNCSYVLNFIIFYCKSEDQKTCDGKATQISVPNNVRMYEVNNLNKDAFYLVWMASSSRVSRSKFTKQIVKNPSTVKVTYIILLCFLVVALTVFPMICIFKYYDHLFRKCKKCKGKICEKKKMKIDVPDCYKEDEKKELSPLREPSNPIPADDEKVESTTYIPLESLNKDPFSSMSLSPYSHIRPVSIKSTLYLESIDQETDQVDILLASDQYLSSGCTVARQTSCPLLNEINDYPMVSSNYVPIETFGFTKTPDE